MDHYAYLGAFCVHTHTIGAFCVYTHSHVELSGREMQSHSSQVTTWMV